VAASVKQIDVASEQALESTIASYIAQGFVVSQRTQDTATLFKKKEFNIIWAIVGFFLCLLPLLVYCIVYATQSDEMVVVKVVSAAAGAIEAQAGKVRWSEDRQWWWDGGRWRDALIELPPGAVRSEDGASWWDGVAWRPAPTGEESGERTGTREPPAEAEPPGAAPPSGA